MMHNNAPANNGYAQGAALETEEQRREKATKYYDKLSELLRQFRSDRKQSISRKTKIRCAFLTIAGLTSFFGCIFIQSISPWAAAFGGIVGSFAALIGIACGIQSRGITEAELSMTNEDKNPDILNLKKIKESLRSSVGLPNYTYLEEQLIKNPTNIQKDLLKKAGLIEIGM